MPILLPFLLGLGIAWCVERPVQLLQKRSRLPRWLASGLCVGALFLLAGGGLYLLLRRLFYELGSFVQQLPEVLAGLAEPAGRLRSWLEGLAARAPDGLGQALEGWVEEFFAGSDGLVPRLTDVLFSAATAFVARLPEVLLFCLTLILSSFMLSAELPQLRRTAARLIPQRWRERSDEVMSRLRQALGGWVKAQLMLMGVTFVLVTTGLFLLRIDFALLFGALIALIDALPIFGVGTVLIPWGLVMFLRGATRCGIGLLLLYGAAALTRSALEPKLIGRQLGLSPVLTLLALYAGYQLLGILGMILFPIAAILLQQLLELAFPRKGA